MQPPLLRLAGLAKNFGAVRAVRPLDLEVARGEIFVLLGASGCGKSTLLRMLAGFETPSHGRIELDGVDITHSPPYERAVNMMFQSYALFPHLNVFDNIAFGLKRAGLPKAQLRERVEEMLSLTQLQALAHRLPSEISGGQQQRVALARSLARRPKLLLLDEPLGALDQQLRERTQIELCAILRQIGVTCVLVTHDQEEAMMMADRIAVMREGAFEQMGTPGAIYETPANLFVASFIGQINLFAGSALRPEKITITAPPPAQTPSVNALRGRICGHTYLGSVITYRVQPDPASGLTQMIKVTQPCVQRRSDCLADNSEVLLSWAPESLVLLTH